MSDLAAAREAEYGYRVVGVRELWRAEAAEKRDRREFRSVVRRIQARNWMRKVYREAGPSLHKVVHAKRTYWSKVRDARRADMEAAIRRGDTITACPGCGADWAALFVPGTPRKWCSDKCYQSHRAHRVRSRGQA